MQKDKRECGGVWITITEDDIKREIETGSVPGSLVRAEIVPYSGAFNSYAAGGLGLRVWSLGHPNDPADFYEGCAPVRINAARAFVLEWGFLAPTHWLPRGKRDILEFPARGTGIVRI